MSIISGYQGTLSTGLSVGIDQGTTLSNSFYTGGFALVGIILPQLFTGSSLSFNVGSSLNGFQAVGEIVFTGQPSNNDTVTINGTVITFVTGTPSGNQVKIGSIDVAETASNLYHFLILSQNAGLLACTYGLNDTVVTVTYGLYGTGGNSITLSKSSSNITVSGSGTLTGGGFRPLYDSSNSLISMTVSQGRAYAVDPTNFQGVSYLQIQSGSSEAAPRILILTLKGF